MYVYMNRLHLLIWYSVQFRSFFYIGISVADLPQMIFDVILILAKGSFVNLTYIF